MSQYLGRLAIGDSIECKGPIGHFEYVGNGQIVKDGEASKVAKLGFICGGTGITPAFQIIKHALTLDTETDCCFALVLANHSEVDILLRKELDELAAAHPARLHLHYTITTPADTAAWQALGQSLGFVNNEMVASHIAADCDYVGLCGPPGLIEYACKPALAALGYEMEHQVFLF
eukprot:SAG22_NODE_147_length_17533_cov_46.384536_16_plen_175_part_00